MNKFGDVTPLGFDDESSANEDSSDEQDDTPLIDPWVTDPSVGVDHRLYELSQLGPQIQEVKSGDDLLIVLLETNYAVLYNQSSYYITPYNVYKVDCNYKTFYLHL